VVAVSSEWVDVRLHVTSACSFKYQHAVTGKEINAVERLEHK